MVKITFFKRDGIYYGFRETGHAGFDDAGKDIVCAAVSAMTMLVINAIEISYSSNVEYSIDEDTADIEVRVPSALPENSDDGAQIRRSRRNREIRHHGGNLSDSRRAGSREKINRV